MRNAIRKPYGGHVFQTSEPLNAHQLNQLVASFRAELSLEGGTLGGRRRMPGIRLDRVGRVVVKSYYRGGLVARFNRRHYIGGGRARSEKEFEWLNRVRKLGIRAPEPIVAARRGWLFYRCWLVSREVAGATSLAQLSIDRPESLDAPLNRCRRQVDRLIAHRILHPDLHPGNVLVDPGGDAWIIDFDRARFYRRGRSRLAARYRQRWCQAVQKYGLPPELAAMISAGSTNDTG